MRLAFREETIQILSHWLSAHQRQGLFSALSSELSYACSEIGKHGIPDDQLGSFFDGFHRKVSAFLVPDQAHGGASWCERNKKLWQRLLTCTSDRDLEDARAACAAVLARLGFPRPPTTDGLPLIEAKGTRLPRNAMAEAMRILSTIDDFELARYTVVGDYARYDEAVRVMLRKEADRIRQSVLGQTSSLENYLLSGRSGEGKTFFVDEIGRTAQRDSGVKYVGVDLKETLLTEQSLRDALLCTIVHDAPCLCRIDEIHARPSEAWPYDIIYALLDTNQKHKKGPASCPNTAYVLIGSAVGDGGALREQIRSRQKGEDMLTRIPNTIEVPPLALGDRVVIVLARLCRVARSGGCKISVVEKEALLHVLSEPSLSSARALEQVVLKAVGRVSAGGTVLTCGHLFDTLEADKHVAFATEVRKYMEALPGKFVSLRGV
jgi:hypothetical protein